MTSWLLLTCCSLACSVPRKFELGAAVLYPVEEQRGMGQAVVVRYQYNATIGRGRGQYVLLRRYGANRLYGETLTRDPHVLMADPERGPNIRASSIVRNNAAILERGCSCNCCIHTAMSASDVRQDGTFVWDDE